MTRASRSSSTCSAPAGCWCRARPAADGPRPSTPSTSTCGHSVPRCCASAGRPRAGRRRRPGRPERSGWTRRTRPGVAAWLAGLSGRPGVVIADDVGAPAEFPVLARLPAPGTGQRHRPARGRRPRPAVRRTTRGRWRRCAADAPGSCSAPARATPTCSASGCRARRSPCARAPDGWSPARPSSASRWPAGDGRPRPTPRVRDRPPAAASEELERRPDLLAGVPGELVTLGLVDDELRVLAAEVGFEHDVDRRPDVLLRVRAVDVRAGDVLEPDVGLPPGRPPGRCPGRRRRSPSRRARRRPGPRAGGPPTGSMSISRRLARAAASRAAYSSSSVSASASLSS